MEKPEIKFLKKGKYREAQAILEKLVKKNPKDAKSLINLGVAYKNQGLLAKAIEVYEKAIKLKYKTYIVYNNLANVYLEQNEFEKAENYFNKAILEKPDYAEAYGNFGVYLQTKKKNTLAKRYYKKAIKLNPNLFDTLSNLSAILDDEGDYKKAFKLSKKALEINPNSALAHNNFGNALRDAGQLDEAEKNYEKAIEIDPYLTSSYPNLLDVLMREASWEAAREIHKKVDENGAETPFLALRWHSDLNHHLKIARSFSQSIKIEAMRARLRLGYWLRKKNEKIKVGYISGNFGKHPVGFMAQTLFPLHDRKEFKIIAYSYGPNDRSETRKKIIKSVDEFVDLKNLSDVQAAKKINKSRVDILVDLTGHTKGGRMGILAHHPSPFQISYFAFSGTSGADFMEYMIVDKTIVPRDEVKYYSEKLIYMPNCYQIVDNNRLKNIKYSKKTLGVDEDTFVFASYNRAFKISEEIFNTWMNILKRVDNSVLIMWYESEITSNNLKKVAKKKKIDPKRLIFVKEIEREDHLKRLSVCDLALDTYEFSGGMTTSDALMMGVPVITIKGYSYLSRMTDSMLKTAGLSQLIAKSFKDYENLAVTLANNPKKMASLRNSLSVNLNSSPLFNPKDFVKNLENEYFKIMKPEEEIENEE